MDHKRTCPICGDVDTMDHPCACSNWQAAKLRALAATQAKRIEEAEAECERLREYRERGMPPDYEIDMAKLRAALERTKSSRERQKARADRAEAVIGKVRELAEKSRYSKFASDLAMDILEAINE